jgi:hypothetical protein
MPSPVCGNRRLTLAVSGSPPADKLGTRKKPVGWAVRSSAMFGEGCLTPGNSTETRSPAKHGLLPQPLQVVLETTHPTF